MAFLRDSAAPLGRISNREYSIVVLNGGMKAMRFAVRALVAGLLMVCCRGVEAAELGASWWPFGHPADATAAQPQSASESTLPSAATSSPSTTAPAAAAAPVAHEAQLPATQPETEPDSHWMLNTRKKKVSWPKFEMPKSLASKSSPDPKTEGKKNRWVEKEPVTPKTSPMESVKKGANSFATGTKSAWHKTVAAVTPGDKTKKPAVPSPPQVARREGSPSIWKKMFGAKEPELQQPQTVPQWMAQKRLDP
jgi:hypothetical protein